MRATLPQDNDNSDKYLITDAPNAPHMPTRRSLFRKIIRRSPNRKQKSCQIPYTSATHNAKRQKPSPRHNKFLPHAQKTPNPASGNDSSPSGYFRPPFFCPYRPFRRKVPQCPSSRHHFRRPPSRQNRQKPQKHLRLCGSASTRSCGAMLTR